MIKSLYIKNYVLIDLLEISFENGFSVITGETGAGKSIILGALSLILGQRADAQSIKQGESKCIIEAKFDVSNYDLHPFCEETGIDYDPNEYIIRRELYDSGRSRAFINDSPVSLSDLKKLGERLVDIHSQHQNMLLAEEDFQLEILDTFAKNQLLLTQYQALFKEYKTSLAALQKLIADIELSKQEEDFLRFQYEALNDAALLDGEQEELETEIDLLSNSETIKGTLYRNSQVLSGEELNLVSSLKDIYTDFSALGKIYPLATDFAKRVEVAYIDLNDLSADLNKSVDLIEHNPRRLEFVESRLNLIYDLQKKYKLSSISELINLKEEIKEKLSQIDLGDEHCEELHKKVESLQTEALSIGKKISQQRKTSAIEIAKKLALMLSDLGMPSSQVEFRLSERDLSVNGLDDLEMLFSANKGISLQPVSKIASGGEISRLMLCFKALMSSEIALPSIVFDEIDTGVSGEIADKMGHIMLAMGKKMQVLAITHLPQVAAKGNIHYKVYKQEDTSGNTKTGLKILTRDERITEIAGMLSGSQITDAAIANAKVMLDKK